MTKRMRAMVLAGAVMFSAVTVSKTWAEPDGQSIVDIALAVNAESGEFSTLIAALQATGLVSVLDGKRQFTVFAPTDAAFAELGLDATNVGALDKATLTNILLYHVAPGERFSEQVLASSRIRMVNKKFAWVSVSGDGAFVNDAELLAPDLIDIDASNGVIHVIDAVLLPPM